MRRPTPAILAACALLSACANVGHFVWVDQYDAPAVGDKGYVIAAGDLLNVRVFNQESMSARGRVRSDGRISLPFLNDVEAAGYTPTALAGQLQTRLKDFVNTPVVTVSVEEVRKLSVSFVGEVGKQGMLPLDPDTGLLQALAAAGGLSETAHHDRIFVLRGSAPTIRVRFDYEKLLHAEGKSSLFRLREGDIVVVE